jgi:hypothetical protein
VDNGYYASGTKFEWQPGVTHYISAPSPQPGASGTQYVFSSWSDGGAQTHSITASASGGTYTANFTQAAVQSTDFVLTASNSQAVAQNQAATYTISVAPANGSSFNGTVTLSMGTLASGLTGTLSTNVISQNSPATLTVATANTTALGMYPILVTGYATGGSTSHSVLAVLGVALGVNPGTTVSVGTIAVPPSGVTISSPVPMAGNPTCSLPPNTTGITAVPDVGTQTITFTAVASAAPATATCSTGLGAQMPQYQQFPLLPEDPIDVSVTDDGQGVWEFEVTSDVLEEILTMSASTHTVNGLSFLDVHPDDVGDGDTTFTGQWSTGNSCGFYNAVVFGLLDDDYDNEPLYANVSLGYLCYEAPPPPPPPTCMQLSKGPTAISTDGNYSEDTTVYVTAVNCLTGATIATFADTGDIEVDIQEDTAIPGYVEIYSQNGGTLPPSVTFTAADLGMQKFTAIIRVNIGSYFRRHGRFAGDCWRYRPVLQNRRG